MSKLTVLSVPGFASWASYLVNDDASGISDDDKAAADHWFDQIDNEHWYASGVSVVSCGDEYIGRLDGVQGDLVDYTIHVHVFKERSVMLSTDTLKRAAVAMMKAEQAYRQAADLDPRLAKLWKEDAAGMAAARAELINAVKVR